MGCLLLDTKDAVEQAKAAERKRLSRKALAELHASYREIIKLGYEENPGLDDPGRRAPAEADQGAEPADSLGPARAGGAAVRARFQGAVR